MVGEHLTRRLPQQTTQVVCFNLRRWIPRLSGRARRECQLCEQRYVRIISCHSAAETRGHTGRADGWIRRDFGQTANVFPPIRGENKHAHVRQQTSSPKAQIVKLIYAPHCRVGTKSFCLLHKHTHTRPHRAPLTAPPLTSLEPRGPHYPHCTSPAWTIADSNVTPTVVPDQRHPNCYDAHNCAHTHTHDTQNDHQCKTVRVDYSRQRRLCVSIKRRHTQRIRDTSRGQSRSH